MKSWLKLSFLILFASGLPGCSTDHLLNSDLDYIGRWQLISVDGILENPNTETILTLKTNNVWQIIYEARLPDTPPVFGNSLGTYSVNNEKVITFLGTDSRGREVIDIQTYIVENNQLMLTNENDIIRIYNKVTD